MNGVKWSAEDIEALDDYVGDVPVRLALQAHRCWAKRNGRPIRSMKSFLSKISVLKLRRRSTGEWISAGAIATYLGNHSNTVVSWIKRSDEKNRWIDGKLHGRQFPVYSDRTTGKRTCPCWYVKRSDLRDFARRNPHFFNHLDRMTLVALFDQEAAADAVLSAERRSYNSMRRRVRCVETGEEFPSISAAAKAQPIARESVNHAVNHGTTAAGFHWEAVE